MPFSPFIQLTLNRPDLGFLVNALLPDEDTVAMAARHLK